MFEAVRQFSMQHRTSIATSQVEDRSNIVILRSLHASYLFAGL